jgi:hypothetical protein
MTPQLRKAILKDGTIKTYEYNYDDYFKDYYSKNKDKINEKFTCEICKGFYTLANKSQHNKGKRHKAFDEFRVKISHEVKTL